MRHASRTDATQSEIIKALRKIGCAVYYIKLPVDLLVCHRGETMLMEVKEHGGRLTKQQVEFIATWPGRVEVVMGPEGAVSAVLGGIK